MSERAAHAGHRMHMGIAEAGKAAALDGDHAEALRHYRTAIRMCVSARAPDVFFRHYTQCAMESLERTGHFAEVIAYCEAADTHYRDVGARNPLQRRDHGSILERLGIVRLKAGDAAGAEVALDDAVAIAGASALPLAQTVLDWLHRGLHVVPRRLEELQRKHGYFVVREEAVDRDRIRPLPGISPGEEVAPYGR